MHHDDAAPLEYTIRCLQRWRQMPTARGRIIHIDPEVLAPRPPPAWRVLRRQVDDEVRPHHGLAQRASLIFAACEEAAMGRGDEAHTPQRRHATLSPLLLSLLHCCCCCRCCCCRRYCRCCRCSHWHRLSSDMSYLLFTARAPTTAENTCVHVCTCVCVYACMRVCTYAATVAAVAACFHKHSPGHSRECQMC